MSVVPLRKKLLAEAVGTALRLATVLGSRVMAEYLAAWLFPEAERTGTKAAE